MEEYKSESDSSTDDSSESAFAKLLQNKLKKGLVPTQTKVTQPDGSVSLYKGQGMVEETSCPQMTMSSSGFGFVVDTKPDLTVGKVKPWLYISSQDVASDPELLKELGITHILSLLPGFVLDPLVKLFIIKHLTIDFYDEESFNLLIDSDSDGHGLLDSALEFIRQVNISNDENNLNGKILVHCNAGLSRAPTVVILYLIKFEGMAFEEAWNLVKSVRSQARPNQGFLRQMKEFGKTSG